MPEIGGVGLLTALFAGMVSFFSPCVLPLVPGYLSAVTGISPAELERGLDGKAEHLAVMMDVVRHPQHRRHHPRRRMIQYSRASGD